MPRTGHMEEAGVAALPQVESGAKVAEVCRKAVIGEVRELRQRRDEDPSIDGLKRRVAARRIRRLGRC